MKNLIKSTSIQILLFVFLAVGLGVAYSAWDDVVSSGDPLSATSWNEVVSKVKNMDNTISFSGGRVGIGTNSPSNMLEISSATQSRVSLTNTGNNDIKIFGKTDRTFGGAGVFSLIGINENTSIGSISILTGSNPDLDGEITLGTAIGGVVSERVRVKSNGEIKISGFQQTYINGSAFVCVNDLGVLFTSETNCP